MHGLVRSVWEQLQMLQIHSHDKQTNKQTNKQTCFQFYPKKGYKTPQELKGPKYMSHLSGAHANIRISLLFEENVIFCPGTTDSFLWAALRPSTSSASESRLPELSQSIVTQFSNSSY